MIQILVLEKNFQQHLCLILHTNKIFSVRFFWRILLGGLGIGLLLPQDKLLKLLIGFSRATTSVQSGLSI
ncbi:hypothetical protein F0562_022115 [Nyssa sinensis]|uniref:Uncharacterized protein n=1 Tax=Nyssa sinensis TaxID=561372 RepID=A0A5J5BLW4_9ASTE|nr:hypothetical protein F0562_022115 [Nyssa sinensis]